VKQDLQAITLNILSHAETILEGRLVTVSKLPKAQTGSYVIRVQGEGCTSWTEWRIKRSVHRNRIIATLREKMSKDRTMFSGC
jgi:hypothetical protein